MGSKVCFFCCGDRRNLVDEKMNKALEIQDLSGDEGYMFVNHLSWC